jgi:hypothetical protein
MEGTMTLNEAKANLNTIYKTLRCERAMREKVIKDPARQAAGIAEIDEALAALLRIKDELKRHLQGMEQATLIDLPKRTSY